LIQKTIKPGGLKAQKIEKKVLNNIAFCESSLVFQAKKSLA